MSLTAFASVAEIVGAIAVVASLIFVGVQLQQHTIQLKRAEKNATNAEASVIRQSVLLNSDVAELVHAAVHETRALSPVEVDRFNVLLWEIAYLLLQFWDRTNYGLFLREEEFEKVTRSFSPYFSSKLGRVWWQTAKGVVRSDFAADFEKLIPGMNLPLASPTETASA
jgi:hypothetical protein